MADLERELRYVLGEPRPDAGAKERALVRLRAEMAEPIASSTLRHRRHRTLVRLVAAALVLLVGSVSLFAISSLDQPAVATELDHLAQANLQWASTETVPPVRFEQWGIQSNNVIGGPSYSLVVRSLITISAEKDGSILRKEEILDRDFYTEEDRAIWKDIGSPDIPPVGHIETQRIPQIYNIAAVPADPEQLRAALESGKIDSSPPDARQIFELVGSLLTQPSLGLDQRQALYEVIGSLDGIELLGDTSDPLGRLGVGFSYQEGSHREVLIFDRSTGQPLAFEEYSQLDPTLITGWEAFDPPTYVASEP